MYDIGQAYASQVLLTTIPAYGQASIIHTRNCGQLESGLIKSETGQK